MPPALYDFLVLGNPGKETLERLEEEVRRAVAAFQIDFDRDVGWIANPTTYAQGKHACAAIIFSDSSERPPACLEDLTNASIPIVPVASSEASVSREIPEQLRFLNCLFFDKHDVERMAGALLECVGLLPRQRRVFLSYRRDESRNVAVQLFHELSARQFDVFLDTHGVPPAVDFQETLWHRLCDSDLLVMLDTPTYFESRWTAEEFGRALSKQIPIVRVGWPELSPAPQVSITTSYDLEWSNFRDKRTVLDDATIDALTRVIEQERSKGHAVRHLELISTVRREVAQISGQVLGVGPGKAVSIRLFDGLNITAVPAVGVPTSQLLHYASELGAGGEIAVVYDHVGLSKECLKHIDWLGQHVQVVKWIRAREAGWLFAGWQGA